MEKEFIKSTTKTRYTLLAEALTEVRLVEISLVPLSTTY